MYEKDRIQRNYLSRNRYSFLYEMTDPRFGSTISLTGITGNDLDDTFFGGIDYRFPINRKGTKLGGRYVNADYVVGGGEFAILGIEGETEIVGGVLTEYSGRRLALFREMLDIELVVGAALIVALFFGGFDMIVSLDIGRIPTALVYGIIFFVKVLFVVGILALIKSVVARYRIDQIVSLNYRWLIPLSMLQIVIIVIAKYMEWL